MAQIDVKLTSKSIRNASDKLRELAKDLPRAMDEVTMELAKQTADQIQKNYDVFPYKGESGKEPIIGFARYDKGWEAYAKGESIFYEEFGTGDKGLNSPHPLKNRYDLNPYNSGKYIRQVGKSAKEHGLTSGKYWTYKNDNGDIIYTQGVPSGKFMYKSYVWAMKNYKKIVEEKVSDVLSKL